MFKCIKKKSWNQGRLCLYENWMRPSRLDPSAYKLEGREGGDAVGREKGGGGERESDGGRRIRKRAKIKTQVFFAIVRVLGLARWKLT